jgi:predicted house-cleaning NTP pyrophosphatase (Maf/HAM1 superfamily)
MTAAKPVLCVGSSSKWRRAIIGDAFGDCFTITTVSPDIDEKAIRRNTAEELTLAISQGKMEAVLEKVVEDTKAGAAMPDFIITSDQVARHSGGIREKPADEAENRKFLRDYRNGSVVTVATFVVRNTRTGKEVNGVNECETYFGDITDEMIERVISRGDSAVCCGGFVVEDPDLSTVVVRVRGGNITSVQGVHVPLLRRLLVEAGADVPSVTEGDALE